MVNTIWIRFDLIRFRKGLILYSYKKCRSSVCIFMHQKHDNSIRKCQPRGILSLYIYIHIVYFLLLFYIFIYNVIHILYIYIIDKNIGFFFLRHSTRKNIHAKKCIANGISHIKSILNYTICTVKVIRIEPDRRTESAITHHNTHHS